MDEAWETSPGFTRQDWELFQEQGFLQKKALLSPPLLAEINKSIDQTYYLNVLGQRGMNQRNFILDHPVFASLIDHASYIGYFYDVFGDALTLLLSNLMIRPPLQTAKVRNNWHFDGPRVVPFKRFSPALPLRIKVGLALTDCLETDMGNLTVLPGSQHQDSIPESNSHEDRSDQLQICMQAGDAVFMSEGLWHKVAPNLSPISRRVIYLEYGPSWIRCGDRLTFTADETKGLSRVQKILLRPYEDPNHFIKIPDADIPIFRRSIPTNCPRSGPEVPLHLQRQITRLEQLYAEY